MSELLPLMHLRLLLIAPLFFACLITHAAERMALVIGNGAYTGGAPLPNPPRDAVLVAESLRVAGFAVTQKNDLGLDSLRRSVEDFQASAREARCTVVAVYYAGHGIEVKGQNYLIPVDAEVREEYQITSRTMPLAELMGAMDNTQAPLKIVVLDCCRDNPLGRSFRRSAAGSGLAALTDTPEGTVIAYATAPGHTALDGEGQNSPFATAFASALRQPGLSVVDVFQSAIGEVKRATKKEQQPWLSLNYEGRFYFLPGASAQTAMLNTPSVMPPSPRQPTTPAQVVAGEMETITPKWPKAMFVGTPVPVVALPNLEKPRDPILSFKAPKGSINVALGKKVTSSDPAPIIPGPDALKLITDGDADGSDGCFVELAPGPQWVQIDLGGAFQISHVLAWHYHRQAVIVKAVIVQISDDAVFKSGVITVYNSDIENSCKQGSGNDPVWVQSNHGRLFEAKNTKGRYVRLWSNGCTMDDFNRYIEVSVYATSAR